MLTQIKENEVSPGLAGSITKYLKDFDISILPTPGSGLTQEQLDSLPYKSGG